MIRLFRRRSGHLDCRQVAAVLQPFLDGELVGERGREVARHLEDCRRCGLEADTYREMKAALRRGVPEPSPESVERLRQFVARLEAGEFDAVADRDA
ncbi:MAG: zf-HC2 domain-containing protein [Actinomycetota bacterium]|nr:zf-HC2 domain-containing protein [Actinomycetota bacterium]